MAHPKKYTQSKARLDTLREEVNIMLNSGHRKDAIGHYQAKSACTLGDAVAFVEQLERDRLKTTWKKLFAFSPRHELALDC